jgi:glucose/arabinose dehydrogenase
VQHDDMTRRWLVSLVLAASLPACGGSNPSGAALTMIADGFVRPTQIAEGPPGTLLVAQLNGDETQARGQVLALDLGTRSRRVLLDGLDKPTGVLWQNGRLWVMVRRSLISAPWAGGPAVPGPITVELAELPYNGRSEGTLTALTDGEFLYDTSGSADSVGVVAGSGTLWRFDPVHHSSTAVAVHAKHAYAHAALADGRIITTEVGDATIAPVEELNVLPVASTPADLGWPACPGDRDCPGITRPLALFAPHATPTGIALVGTHAYVALFNTGELRDVPLAGWSAGAAPVTSTVIARELKGPYTVLARPDGVLWISEHFTGRIVAIRRPGT